LGVSVLVFQGGFWVLCGFFGLNVYAEWVTSVDFFELFLGPAMFLLASLSMIVGPSAIVFGFVALVAITRSGESLIGRRDAIFGLCVGTVPVALFLIVAFWAGSYRI